MVQPEARYVGVRVTPQQYAVVHANCQEQGTTISAVLRELLDAEGWFAPHRQVTSTTKEQPA